MLIKFEPKLNQAFKLGATNLLCFYDVCRLGDIAIFLGGLVFFNTNQTLLAILTNSFSF